MKDQEERWGCPNCGGSDVKVQADVAAIISGSIKSGSFEHTDPSETVNADDINSVEDYSCLGCDTEFDCPVRVYPDPAGLRLRLLVDVRVLESVALEESDALEKSAVVDEDQDPPFSCHLDIDVPLALPKGGNIEGDMGPKFEAIKAFVLATLAGKGGQ